MSGSPRRSSTGVRCARSRRGVASVRPTTTSTGCSTRFVDHVPSRLSRSEARMSHGLLSSSRTTGWRPVLRVGELDRLTLRGCVEVFDSAVATHRWQPPRPAAGRNPVISGKPTPLVYRTYVRYERWARNGVKAPKRGRRSARSGSKDEHDRPRREASGYAFPGQARHTPRERARPCRVRSPRWPRR